MLHPFSHVRGSVVNPPPKREPTRTRPKDMTSDKLFSLPYNEIIEFKQMFPLTYKALSAERGAQSGK